MRKKILLAIVGLMLVSGLAFAGGGDPQPFNFQYRMIDGQFHVVHLMASPEPAPVGTFINSRGLRVDGAGTLYAISSAAATPPTLINSVLGVAQDANGYLIVSVTGGGSMTWPTGGAGIPNYNGSSAWGTTYSASNQIPSSFIMPLTFSSSSSIPTGAVVDITATGTSAFGTNNANGFFQTNLPNDGTTPTVAAETACENASGNAQLCGANTKSHVIGACVSGCGSSGYPKIAVRGNVAALTFDSTSAVTAGHWVVTSATPGLVADSGSTTFPTCGNQVVGVATTSGLASTVQNVLQRADALQPCGTNGQVWTMNGTTGSQWGAAPANTALSNLTTPVVNPNSSILGIPTTNLIGEFLILPSETVSALVDYSGQGNNATGTVGTAPPIISTTGGLTCPAAGAVSLPSGLNSAETIIAVVGMQDADYGGPFGIVSGTGTSGANSIGMLLAGTSFNNNSVPRPSGAALKPYSYGNSATQTVSYASWQGIGDLTLAMGVNDVFYVNGAAANSYVSGASVGLQTAGNYQVCGSSTIAYGNTAVVYGLFFWSSVLSAQQIAQAHQAIQSYYASRGVSYSLRSLYSNGPSILVFDGDSIAEGHGGAYLPTAYILNTENNIFAPSTLWISNVAEAGQTTAGTLTNGQLVVDPNFNSVSNIRQAVLNLVGTNNISSGTTQAGAEEGVIGPEAAYCAQRHAAGALCAIGTVMSKNGADAGKDVLNAMLYQRAPQIADQLVDLASDPRIGADNAYSNTTYFNADGIHPTQATVYNILTPMEQRAYNIFYGNASWTSANTYTASGAAATNCSGASQSSYTMTFTGCTGFTAKVGSEVTTAGWTPSGYNNTWFVISSSSGTFTAYGFASGLGNSSVAGTAQQAYDQVDQDIFTILGGSSSGQVFRLETCVGVTGQRRKYMNTDTNNWTLQPFGSETINGASTYTLTPNTVVSLESVLVSTAAGGCNWDVSF